jgi:outer membrane protein assembly factor BamE
MRFTPLSLLQRSTPLLAAAVLAACASQPATVAPVDASQGAQTTTITKAQKVLWFFSPYRPDIQQGNFVSQEMLAQLKPGMSKEQVKFLLGTPLMADPFHAQRWDYPFRLAKGNGELTTSTVVVYFDQGDKVERFEGGNLPTEQQYIARIAGPIKDFKKSEAAKDNLVPGKSPLPGGQESGQKQ